MPLVYTVCALISDYFKYSYSILYLSAKRNDEVNPNRGLEIGQ